MSKITTIFIILLPFAKIIHMQSNREVENILRNIVNQAENGSATNKAIGMYLLSMYRKNNLLPKITVLSQTLYVSNAAISKFIMLIGLENYLILRFIFRLNSQQKNSPSKISLNEIDEEKLNYSAKLIQNSNRILMVGEGTSLNILTGFNINLVKYGFNVILVTAPGDQKFIAEKLEENDLIIICSISMTKEYINTIIAKSKASKIIFTSLANLRTNSSSTTFKIKSKNIANNNEFSYTKRIDILEIMNLIHKKLEKKWRS